MPLTNIKKGKLFLEPVFPSKIELYYTEPEFVNGDRLAIKGEEVKHISSVMRHNPGDILFVTDGTGHLFETEIQEITKKEITALILKKSFYEKELPGIVFCIARLKNADRFEFALEKAIELGVTDFMIYDSENSVAKGDKSERWNKIALAAMKQSLRFYLPKIIYLKSLFKLPEELKPVLFEQEFREEFFDFVRNKRENIFSGNEKYCFIFGPEGGLSAEEQNFNSNAIKVSLTKNRLRSETAIITAAGILAAGRL